MTVSKKLVVIDYTNWRGERRERLIRPVDINFRSTYWHPDPQWLLHAIDVEKARAGDVDADRDFALTGIHSWREVAETPALEGTERP